MVTREKILDIVKEHLMDNLEDLDDKDFIPSKSMKDLGANSLDIVEVVSCTMRDLKIKVPRAELSNLTNIDGLVDLLYQVAQEKEQQQQLSQRRPLQQRRPHLLLRCRRACRTWRCWGSGQRGRR